MRYLRLLLIVTGLLLVFAAAVFAVRLPCVAVVLVGGLLVWRLRRRRAGTSHGSAEWAGWGDVGSMVGGSGVPAGMMFDRPTKWQGVKALFNPRLSSRDAVTWFLASWGKGAWRRLKLNDSVHVAVFCPTGGGKSSGITIPFLRSTTASVVIYSPKADELEATTAHRRALGQRVIVLAPFGVSGVAADTLNPLDVLDPAGETAVDDARDLGGLLVVKNPAAHDPFFEDSARLAVTAFALAMARMLEPPERTPANLRTLLASKWDEVVAAMRSSGDPPLATMGHALAQLTDKTKASVQATVTTHLAWADSPAVRRATTATSFDPRAAFEQGVSIFIVIPPERLQQQIPLLRAWLHVLMLAACANGTRTRRQVHFVIEEAAQLGPFDLLEKGINVGRGYGLRFLLLYQNVGQLKRNFTDGQDQTVLGNVTQVFFHTNDYPTAEFVSNRLGDETLRTASGGHTAGRSGNSQPTGGDSHGYSVSHTSNWNLMGRRLLQASEVLALHPQEAVVFVPGRKPLFTWIDRYFENAREGVGPVKAAVRTLALFLAALGLAAFAVTCQPPPPRDRPPVAKPLPETTDGQDESPDRQDVRAAESAGAATRPTGPTEQGAQRPRQRTRLPGQSR